MEDIHEQLEIWKLHNEQILDQEETKKRTRRPIDRELKRLKMVWGDNEVREAILNSL
jgi:hypothetical protein